MKNSDGAYIQACNARAVVDAEHQVITAADVTCNASDALNYTTMLDQSAANTGVHPKQALVDADYCSEANLEAAKERQLACGTDTFSSPLGDEVDLGGESSAAPPGTGAPAGKLKLWPSPHAMSRATAYPSCLLLLSRADAVVCRQFAGSTDFQVQPGRRGLNVDRCADTALVMVAVTWAPGGCLRSTRRERLIEEWRVERCGWRGS